MNPERITTLKFFGSFTATHWSVVLTVIFACISSVAGGAYWAGQKLAVAESLTQQAELKGTITQLQAKLEVVQSRVESLVTENAKLHEVHQKQTEMIEQKDIELSRYSAVMGRANNCSFIHEQIRVTRSEIDWVGRMVMFSQGKEINPENQTRRAVLEKRLEGYQQQLGSCNK